MTRLAVFSSKISAKDAIEKANEKIEKMEELGWEVVQISQSELDAIRYTFNLTVVFRLE